MKFKIISSALLAINVVLLSTFTYSVVTQTPNVEPWHSIATTVNSINN
jgi:hypothetical protein